MPIFLEEDFWQFSLFIYEKNDNKENFLWLQDKLNLNVNLLLFALYLVEEGFQITDEQFLRLNQYIAVAEEETNALRLRRRNIPGSQKTELIYKAALQEELDSEKRQQAQLIENVTKLDGLYEYGAKLPEKVMHDHLHMLFTAYSKVKNDGKIANLEAEFSLRSQAIINNFLLKA